MEDLSKLLAETLLSEYCPDYLQRQTAVKMHIEIVKQLHHLLRDLVTNGEDKRPRTETIGDVDDERFGNLRKSTFRLSSRHQHPVLSLTIHYPIVQTSFTWFLHIVEDATYAALPVSLAVPPSTASMDHDWLQELWKPLDSQLGRRTCGNRAPSY